MFGSAVDQAADPGDVDLAVLAQGDLDVLGLLERLYTLTGYEDFDVLDLRRASVVARERALLGARLLRESRPGLFANSQIAAIMERMDTDAMRRVELELMTR
jgi:hypothetical protein